MNKLDDLQLKVRYKLLGVKIRKMIKKLDYHAANLDIDAMKYYQDVIHLLIMKREDIFNKRLQIRGYQQ